jgi:hypothetical protein
MQKARGHPFRLPGIGLPPLVGARFQVHCPPLVGVLPIVRSRYSALSVAGEYLALGDGPPGFRPTSTWWAVLRIPLGLRPRRLGGSHPLWPAIPRRWAGVSGPRSRSYNPGGRSPPGLGWSRFARRYSGSRCCFPLLGVLRCFSSPRPLGHPGVNARVTAPPGFSQPSAPFGLPAPRHPPRALSSLATPPPGPLSGDRGRDVAVRSLRPVSVTSVTPRSNLRSRRPARPADPPQPPGARTRDGTKPAPLRCDFSAQSPVVKELRLI